MVAQSPFFFFYYLLHIGLPSGIQLPTPTSLPSASIFQGRYRYTDELLCLTSSSSPSPPQNWPRYQSPIKLEELAPFLHCHPDQAFAAYIHTGLSTGFRVGYSQNRSQLRSSGRNHPSSLANEAVIDDRIASELAAGRLLGPISPHLLSDIHISPLGLVPKAHQPNQWRMICDLSSPSGASVNDGISRDLSSLQYATVDEAVRIIQHLGHGTQLVKLDIKDAYRIVPVHPDDYHLLGIRWKGSTYIDRALPFGLRSAPKLFTALADFVAWVLACKGIQHQLHYLDDFLFLAAPNSQQGQEFRTVALQTLARLGIPVAAHKTEGPTTALAFLGIVVNTSTFELHLPMEKLTRLQETIQQWTQRRSCTQKELESFLGHLSHAATVIPLGRIFLRQLFSLLALDRAPHHYIRLNLSARADLVWWRVFLQDWNGKSFFPVTSPFSEVFSDASGTFGCGAFTSSYSWFQICWPDNWQSIHITAKELLPIVVAAAVWGSHWSRRRICFRCDNMAVVELLKRHTSQDQLLMHLLRCLAFYAAYFRFQYQATHVPGVQNTAADALSRNNMLLFTSLIPQGQQVCIPPAVLDLLVHRRPDWGSQAWTNLFKISLTRESPLQQDQSMIQGGDGTSSSATSAT